MKENKRDPIKEIVEADLCIHCIHHDICIMEEEIDKLARGYNNRMFGMGIRRKLGEIAEKCRKYKRAET